MTRRELLNYNAKLLRGYRTFVEGLPELYRLAMANPQLTDAQREEMQRTLDALPQKIAALEQTQDNFTRQGARLTEL